LTHYHPSSELRTPIHQIKNLATLLRSGVSEGSSKSTLLTAIKDIEVASHRLEMVTNNVLSYFEVQADATETKASRDAIEKKDLLNNHTNRVLEIMMLDLIEAMASTDTNARIQQEDTTPEIEIVLEIMPPFLGETVEEDKNGSLAR
jgi:signal transduction histidine kinase